MKRIKFILLFGGLILPLAGFSESKIVPVFEGVKDYTDFSVSGISPEKTLGLFEAELDMDLGNWAKKFLKDGQTLTITFTDIDMAGDIQPWRNRYNADIRYVEAVYPPRLSFTYSLKDADGTVVKEGKDSITDLNFQNDSVAMLKTRYSSFYYERTLLENWIRRNIPDKK